MTTQLAELDAYRSITVSADPFIRGVERRRVPFEHAPRFRGVATGRFPKARSRSRVDESGERAHIGRAIETFRSQARVERERLAVPCGFGPTVLACANENVRASLYAGVCDRISVE